LGGTGEKLTSTKWTVARWTRIGLALVIATLLYNLVEAAISIWAGSDAGSIALFGFGLDSLIESAAAAVLLWRLSVEARGADRDTVERSELWVHRFVGGTLIGLALYVVVQSAWTLWSREHPSQSLVGIVLASTSLVVMPLVAWGKFRAAREIGSSALRSEAKETLACAYLSLTLLAGLALNAALGWWWADPVAALLMAPWLVKEGIEGLSGEDDDDDD
jgi:divalent metal cation (Fe/Co/Zn/Cd) transporter